MTSATISELISTYPLGALTVLDPDTSSLADVPTAWVPILTEPSAAARLRLAMSLWNTDFTAMVPRTTELFTTEGVDVRIVGDGHALYLAYLIEHHRGTPYSETRVWLGGQPAPSTATPPLWNALPVPLQTFLTTVHAGLTDPNLETFGPQSPAYLQTLAESVQSPDGIEGWDHDLASTRLLIVADDGGVQCAVSPDLPLGTGTMLYQADCPDPATPLGQLLDEIVTATL